MSLGIADSIFEILHEKAELAYKAGERSFDQFMKKWGARCLAAAFACFPLLGLVALVFTTSGRRPEFLGLIGQSVALLMSVLALLSQLAEIARSVYDLSHFKKDAFDSLRKTFEHDVRNAESLDAFALADLEFVDKWLALRIDRMKLRLGMFLGGSDKVAVFALAGTGWTAWHTLRAGGTSWEDKLYMYGLAFLAGLALGGVLMNSVIKKLSYQRDLLALAIARKEQADARADALA